MTDQLTDATARSIRAMLLGEKLGQGCSRVVYANRLSKGQVVKIEETSCSFDNVMEWAIWEQASSELRRWLAPCVEISPHGDILIMERTWPVPPGRLPAKMPACFYDEKHSNVGLYKGRVVFHDYAYVLHAVMDGRGMRLVKARWKHPSEVA